MGAQNSLVNPYAANDREVVVPLAVTFKIAPRVISPPRGAPFRSTLHAFSRFEGDIVF